jgi:hypothetical protein
MLCLGMCLRDLHLLEESTAVLKMAVAVDPLSASSYIELGKTQLLSQDMKVLDLSSANLQLYRLSLNYWLVHIALYRIPLSRFRRQCGLLLVMLWPGRALVCHHCILGKRLGQRKTFGLPWKSIRSSELLSMDSRQR